MPPTHFVFLIAFENSHVSESVSTLAQFLKDELKWAVENVALPFDSTSDPYEAQRELESRIQPFLSQAGARADNKIIVIYCGYSLQYPPGIDWLLTPTPTKTACLGHTVRVQLHPLFNHLLYTPQDILFINHVPATGNSFVDLVPQFSAFSAQLRPDRSVQAIGLPAPQPGFERGQCTGKNCNWTVVLYPPPDEAHDTTTDRLIQALRETFSSPQPVEVSVRELYDKLWALWPPMGVLGNGILGNVDDFKLAREI